MEIKKEISEVVKYMAELFLQKQKHKNLNDRATRGRIASLSNEFEDKFALFLTDVLPDTSVLVDYALSYRISTRKRARTVYPDIVIIKNDQIEAILELKIDLGYAKKDWFVRKQEGFDELKTAGKVTFKTNRRDLHRLKNELKISPNVKGAFVILSGKNDKGKIAKMQGLSNVFILSKNRHPNGSKITDSTIGAFIAEVQFDSENQLEWDKLGLFLNQLLPMKTR